MKKTLLLLIAVCMVISAASSAVTVRGIDLDFVTIGNAGNAADSTGYGSVDYTYQIGTYEITANQWQTINTVAGIGDPGYWSGNLPTGHIAWYEAAQFCNYLTSGNKYSGAYNFNSSGDFLGIDRAASIATHGTTYVIPTEDEWYKAAYYTGSGYSLYANGTDTAPIEDVDSNYGYESGGQLWDVGNGTQEQNGTFNMMGNVWEWNETLIYSYRGLRGGSYINYDGVENLRSSYRNYGNPILKETSIGFRVASIPEPATLSLLAFGGLALLRKRK